VGRDARHHCARALALKSVTRQPFGGANGVSPEELDKAKTQARLGLIRGRDTDEQIATALGEEAVFAGDANRVNTEWAKIQQLTRDDQAVPSSVGERTAHRGARPSIRIRGAAVFSGTATGAPMRGR
jgi:hypothetical protein